MSAPVLDEPELVRLGERQGFVAYARDIWHRRAFIWNIAVGNLRSQHMDTVLGNLWHLLNPLLMLGVYWLVFGVLITREISGVEEFVPFLAVGIFVYRYCQTSIVSGAGSIVNNVGLIRSLQFPRAVLPVSAVVQNFVAFLPAIAVMWVVLAATGEPPVLGWFSIVPVAILATLFGIGGALITARMVDMVKDVQNVLPFVFRLLFYLSGVLFSVDRLVGRAQIGWLAENGDIVQTVFLFNPFYDIIGIARHYMLSSYDEPDIALMWAGMVGITAVTLLIGVVFFRRGEGGYGRG